MPASLWRRTLALAAALLPLAAAIPTAEAAGSVRSAVSLTAPTSGAYGSTITLAGVLWRYQTTTRIAGATVTLQRTPHGKTTWAKLQTARTSSTGSFSFKVTQTGAYDYRATYAGSATYTSAVSAVRYPATTQKVVLEGLKTSNAWTGELTALGQVYPTPPDGTPIYLQRWNGKAWTGVATGKTSGGQAIVKGRQPGSVASYRLVIATRYPYAAGISNTRSHTHYVWRGLMAKPVEVSARPTHHFDIDPTDKTRRRVTMWATDDASMLVSFDPSGCTAFHGYFRNTSPNETVYLNLTHGPREAAHRQLTPGQVGPIDFKFPWAERSRLESFGRPFGYHVKAELSLLCIN